MSQKQWPRCEYPGCPDTASRKFPEMVERHGRTCCVFRLFCAGHIPADVMHMTAPVQSTPPTHRDPHGKIHVPRVWEVTGKAASDQLDAEREWRKSRELLDARRALTHSHPRRRAIAHAGTRSR